jgi:nucleoside diphosphate kinase
MVHLTAQHCQTFYAEHLGKAFYQNLQNFMTSDFVVGMELLGDNAI